MRHTLIFISIMLLAFSSCKKDKGSDPGQSPEQLIIGTWAYTAAYYNKPTDMGNGVPITNYYTFLDSCHRDDLLIFKTNDSVDAAEGPTQCSSGPQIYASDKWTLSNSVLTIFNIKATVLQLDNTMLKVSIHDTIQGQAIILTSEYKRK